MKSFFNSTFSEFKKLIISPIVIIMFVLIIAVSLFSTFIFNPLEKESKVINLNTSTPLESYNEFITNYKSNYDNSITNSDEFIGYFENLNLRKSQINTLYNEILTALSELRLEIHSGDSEILRTKYQTFGLKVNNFITKYKDFTNLNSIEYITKIDGSTYFEESISDAVVLNNQINAYYTEYVTNPSLDENEDTVANGAEAANAINNYYTSNNYDKKLADINNNSMNFIYIMANNIFLEIKTSLNIYCEYILNTPNQSSFAVIPANNRRDILYNNISDYKAFVNSICDSEYYIIFINKDIKHNLEEKLTKVLSLLNLSPSEQSVLQKHRECVSQIKALDFTSNIEEFNNSQNIITINNNVITNLTEISQKVAENKLLLLNEIEMLKNQYDNNKLLIKITNYKDLTESYKNLLFYSLVIDSTNNEYASEITKFYGTGFENYNEYYFKTSITLSKYYIINNVYPSDFIDAYEFNTINNGNAPNVYDYTLFATSINMVLIIILILIISCVLVSRESSKGTLKLQLMRPCSRTAILNGKITATFIIAILFVIVSAIVSLIVGTIYYPTTNTQTILSVFNASAVFQMSSAYCIFIAIISQIFEILFYTCFCFMFSVIFRKFILAIFSGLTVLTCLFTIKVTLFTSTWTSFLPTLNTSFYKYFVATNFVDNSLLINKIFNSHILSNMNFVFTIALFVAYMIIFYVVNHSVFSTRDY